jgi:hypothetical protein
MPSRFGEGKEILDRYFEFARQPQSNGGVGNVAAGFDRIDRLPAHAHALGQLGGCDAADLADRREAAFN